MNELYKISDDVKKQKVTLYISQKEVKVNTSICGGGGRCDNNIRSSASYLKNIHNFRT